MCFVKLEFISNVDVVYGEDTELRAGRSGIESR